MERYPSILITAMKKEDQDEQQEIITYGDSIASQFYFGNWSDGVKELEHYDVSAKEFFFYLEEMAEEIEGTLSDIWGGHFDTEFWMELQKEIR